MARLVESSCLFVIGCDGSCRLRRITRHISHAPPLYLSSRLALFVVTFRAFFWQWPSRVSPKCSSGVVWSQIISTRMRYRDDVISNYRQLSLQIWKCLNNLFRENLLQVLKSSIFWKIPLLWLVMATNTRGIFERNKTRVHNLCMQ